MAASSGDGIPKQLAALLGKETVQIRRTDDENPPRISVIDVAIAVTGKTQHDAAQDFRRLSDQYPKVGTNCSLYKFKGRRWVHTVRPHIKLLQCFSRYGLYCNPLKHTCFEVLRHA